MNSAEGRYSSTIHATIKLNSNIPGDISPMGRSPCCDENGLKKGPWAPEEDQKLVQYIQKHGHGSWRALPKLAGLNRCGKSCRLRWTNYLRPDIKRGKFSPEEEQTILNLHSILGNKWSAIATHLPGRTDNEIKNFWNTHLKKKMIHMGFDPMTHRPRTDFFAALPQLLALANLGELIGFRPWDDHAARLQAETIQAAKLHCFQYLLQSAAAVANNTTNATSGVCTNPAATNNVEPVSQLLGPQMTSPSILQGSHYDKIIDQLVSINDQITLPLCTDAYQTSNSTEFALPEERINAGAGTTPLLMSPRDSSLPPLADFSAFGNQQHADACSTNSSCGVAGSTFPSFWPTELFLDDQFMTEFA